ncbi:MAG: hypothetical protein ABIQ30_12210 [Devosia sp.]
MPTAKIELANGTTISIEGDVADVERVARVFSNPPGVVPQSLPKKRGQSRLPATDGPEMEFVDIPGLVRAIRDCDDAQAIEERILDQRDNLNLVLLPIFILNWQIDEQKGLTSGDVSRVTDQLGVKVLTSNASKMLSGKARAYVSGDTVRKKGSAVRYKMTRRGIAYMRGVIGIA